MNYTNIEKQQVLELHQAGKSIRQISSYTNIPKSTVADWIKECNQSTPKEVSGHSPENPDRFHEKFPENIGQNVQKDLSDVPELDRSLSEQQGELQPLDKSQQHGVKKLSPEHVSYTDDTETQIKEQPENDFRFLEDEIKINESQARKESVRIKLVERRYVDSLKSITRYYRRKRDWTTEELLTLQERVAKLKAKMENFYSKYSSMDWSKDGLKYLLDIEDDIEESLDCEEEEPLELVPSKMMKSVFKGIKDL